MLIAAAALVLAVSSVGPPQGCIGSGAASVRRGNVLLAAFNGPAAADAFRSAERASRRCAAAAALGLAQAEGPNLNFPVSEQGFSRAPNAIRRALRLRRQAPEPTRSIIETVAVRYSGSFRDFPRTNEDYIRALRRFDGSSSERSLEAELLLAQALLEQHLGTSLWTNPEEQTRAEIGALLHDVLAHDPLNLLANHLAVHFHDFDPDLGAALPSANRLASLHPEPDAEHLVHMAAHAYVRAGRYAQAVRISAKALVLGRRAMYPIYRRHDFFVGEGAAFMGSDYTLARRYLTTFCGPQTGPCLELRPLAAMRFGRWGELAALTRGRNDPLSLMLYARALFGQGQVHRADAAFRHLRLAAPRLADEPNETSIAQALAHHDQGRLLALVRGLEFESPAPMPEMLPLFPARETAGRALLAVGRAGEAIPLLKADLRLYPCSIRAASALSRATGHVPRPATTCAGGG